MCFVKFVCVAWQVKLRWATFTFSTLCFSLLISLSIHYQKETNFFYSVQHFNYDCFVDSLYRLSIAEIRLGNTKPRVLG